ncbi:MAG: 4Fe-4S dicluster domain-containing protein [Coriobacteriaceae bacterium]|jgi:ferredoxin|nr:4Fe-4S dicluster domain-containing protein [Coriobacteriaceae bacterium]
MLGLDSLAEVLGKIQSDNIRVCAEACVVVRNRNAQCTRCVDACTSGAISLQENRIEVEPIRCIGCGTCASVCPTGALIALNPDDEGLLRAAGQTMRKGGLGSDPAQGAGPIPGQPYAGAVTFLCSEAHDRYQKHYDRSQVVELACLGRIEETELIALLAAGAPKINLVQGGCSRCENKNGAKTVDLVRASLESLLKAWGYDAPVELTEELPEGVRTDRKGPHQVSSAGGISRRDFFKQLRGGAQEAVGLGRIAEERASIQGRKAMSAPEASAVAPARPTKEELLARNVPARRERLLDCLDKLGKPVVDRLETRLWGFVEIDMQRCNGCRMCATFCPTGALARADTGTGECGIEHYPAHCVQCRLCEDSCALGALRVLGDVPVQDLVNRRKVYYPLNAHPYVKGAESDPELPVRAIGRLIGQGIEVRLR